MEEKKSLTIQKIILKDWKGLNIEVSFNKGKTVVKGKNGIGKSSIIHAHNWLWSGYTDANSVKNYELFDNTKPLDQNTPIASVKEYITIGDYEYTVERTAEAKFVRKRASNEYEKASSDVYTTKIDDIETSAIDFGKWIERNICPLDLIPYLLDGTFFANLTINDKQKARKVLERIVGEVKDSDLTGDYDELKEKMTRFTLEEIKTQTKNQIKPLNVSSKELETLIKSDKKQLAKFEQTNFDDILEKINEKKREIKSFDESITYATEAIKPIADKRAEITNKVNDILSKLGDKRIHYELSQKEQVAKLEMGIETIEAYNKQVKKENAEEAESFAGLKKKKAALEKKIEKKKQDICFLRDRLKEIKGRIFTDTKCAYCGQELPSDMLAKAQEKFNHTKQKDYEDCVSEGKDAARELEDLEYTLEAYNAEIEAGIVEKPFASKEDIEQEIKDLKASFVPFEDTEEYQEASKKVEELRLSMPIMPTVDNSEVMSLRAKAMDELETYNRQYGRKEDKDRIQADIEEKTNSKFECDCKKAELEGMLDMIKEYESERARIVSDRVNDKLEGCQVYMWSILKSGERVEDCVLADEQGVKYATKNNSDRIKMCINVQKMFCRHFGIDMPIFLDESSIFDSTNLPSFEEQTVYMYASDDTQLIVE